MERLSNEQNIPLAMAVWLSVDEYNHVADTEYISATSLLKSLRQLVLSERVEPKEARVVDVSNMVKSRIGTAIHNSVETSWTDTEARVMALRRLGYPDKVIDRIIINPEPGALKEGDIPVYLEQRVVREIDGFKLGGQYDMVTDGILSDIKTTSTWTYLSGSNDWKYRMQGSIYRWLSPEIITKDYMYIQFVFLNWTAGEYAAKKNQGYPPSDILPYKLELVSLPETELYIKDKLNSLTILRDVPERELPLCTQADLWQDKPTYKYYKNPSKTTRSTKNFQTQAEANIRWIEDGQVGIVKEVPGNCRACRYCAAFDICSQKDTLIAQGLLTL